MSPDHTRSGSEPTRVVVLAPTLWHAGGLVRWSRELVRSVELVASPEEVQFDVVVRHRLDFAASTVQDYGMRCRLHEVGVDRSTTRGQLGTVRRIAAVLGAIGPDVVHVPMGSVWLLGVRRPPCPVVITCHGAPTRDNVARHDRLIARRFVRSGRATLVANAAALRRPLDELVGVAAGTSITLVSGTDPEPVEEADEFRALLHESFQIEQGERVVVSVGRLIPVKRFDLVLEVAQQVRAAGARVRFMIVGDGPERAALEQRSAEMGLDGSVHFVGHVVEPGGYYLGADALLVTSDSEGGGPLVVVEALLAGLAVVATDVGGAPELLSDPINGSVAPRGDAEALARLLLAQLDEPDRRAERAALARPRYSLEAMGRAHLDLIRRVTGRR